MFPFYIGTPNQKKIVDRLITGGYHDEARKFQNLSPGQQAGYIRCVGEAILINPTDEDLRLYINSEFDVDGDLLSFNARTIASIIRKI